jgi:hypothetical protein
MKPGYDAGLYHIPHQLIIRDEKIIFGLANMHGRFGFSSIYEYIAAPLWLNENYKLLAYLQISFWIIFITFLLSLLDEDSFLGRGIVFTSVIFLITANLLGNNLLDTFGYGYVDMPMGVLYFVSFCLGTKLLIENEENTSRYLSCMVVAIATFMMKSNGALILLFTGTVFLLAVWRKNISFLYALKIISIPIVICVLWIVRGFITTGCFLFPLSYTCTDVPWNATHQAVSNMQWVTAWSRHPRSGLYSLENWSWLDNWWLTHYRDFIFIVIKSTFSSLVISTALLLRPQFRIPRITSGDLPAIFILLSMTIWFLQSPHPRFGIALFICLPLVFLISLYGRLVERKMVIRLKWGGYVLISLFVVSLVYIERGRLKFEPKVIPTPKVLQGHPDRGVSPITVDQCWAVRGCNPYNENLFKRSKFGYLIAIKPRE